jgi:hypothetical protein
MKKTVNKRKIVHWLPRVLSVAFVLFLSLFALDVFAEYTGWILIWALLMHLLPSLILLGVVIISWKHDLAGAIIFLGFAVFYVCAAGLGRPWTWYAFISGPALIVAALFFIGWLQERKPKD